MAIEWDMAAVFAALAIFGAPIAWKIVSQLARNIQKERQLVPQFKWDDVPPGRLHDCNRNSPYVQALTCSHSHPHSRMVKCWESDSSLATSLSRAWDLAMRRQRYLDKVPGAVPAAAAFVCTDVRTIPAHVLCTAPHDKSLGWSPRHLRFGTTRVTCESLGPLLFCHIQGQFQARRKDLTKNEVESMLGGYPPWYRDTFTTRAKASLAFPIRSENDISRGGWIVAVGLMDSDLPSQSPLAVYCCPRGTEPDKPDFRGNGVIFRAAVARCRDHIAKHIQPHFSTDNNVCAAIVMLNHLIIEKTGSGIPSPGDFSKTWRSSQGLPHLRGSDCRFVMNDFNAYQTLGDADVARYRPILLSAMAAVVHGAYEVVQYLKDTGVELRLPPELENLDREVFLKDCATILPLQVIIR
ncbi:hypothetical protein MAPG_00267 [Magnaporthiopsis poae ATCC 64411]|uniref:Uncharacterized protein n=1 Tax=Magnaporthiopsis poae (strain ATCC 64411 / 73-15) TaxID=644358 RepID=A0A0C4DKJ3_MAGP6|nr:hypothetical protein MAPG_00267 [Magnaporthiopsis poae ATCC 64411]